MNPKLKKLAERYAFWEEGGDTSNKESASSCSSCGGCGQTGCGSCGT